MEGMLKFKKPKKKVLSLIIIRKKEKFDLDAGLEAAEDVSVVGLGVGDMGSRMDGKRRSSSREEQERSEAETRNNAYQSACAKAEEAAKALRLVEQTHTTTVQIEGDNPVFRDDDLRKSLERARKLLALKKQVEPPSSSVFTEMEEFVWGLQLDKESHKPDGEGEEEVVPDETIHEVAIGKGLSGTLQLLRDRGTLKESVVWGGRNMDKKKSKLVGIHENDGSKEIRIESTDEYGRILTPKEAFRLLSHKFHGKGPGKRKQEKRMQEYQDELKVKQMKNADTPSLSVEKMIAIQARLKRPYLDVTRNMC